METASKIISDAMYERRISQSDVARKLGISPQSVQQWCAGKSHPRGRNLAALSEYLGIAPDILLFGSKERTIVTSVKTDDGFVSIPRFSISGSCGGGALNTQCQLVEMMRVAEEWLLAKCPNINFKHLEVITAIGDSMSPTIENLDFVFVDRSVTDIKRDGIYVVSFAGDVFIKRIQKQINGGLLLISDNAKYPPINVDPADMERLTVEGLCKIHCSADEM